MKKNNILLINCNRDGSKVWLEHVKDNIYTIKATKEYILEYASENYDALPLDAENYDMKFTDQYGEVHKGNIVSFDPSGGPYISIGSIYEGYIIKRIFHIENELGTFFEVEKNS